MTLPNTLGSEWRPIVNGVLALVLLTVGLAVSQKP